MSGALLSPAESLKVVASTPGALDKTAEDLRKAAKYTKRQAERADRLHAGRMASNRRAARVTRASKDADKLHAYADLALAAAEEVERRKAQTVEEALRHPVVRFLRRLGVRRG